MATAADALAAANAATATARIDTMETQLDKIAQQLQVLIAAAGDGGGGGGGGGLVVQPIADNQRRRIDPSGLEKLQGDVRLPQLRTWRNRWNDF